MKYLLFIPALLLFLYSLYRLAKDDYIFIRKNISLEQSFDIAFIALWVGLFMARLLYLLFHIHTSENIFFDFFSIGKGGLSLTGVVIGGIIAIYLIGKYRKIPFGRLCDFLSLSFLYSLPLVFLANSFFVTRDKLLSAFLSVIIYFVLLLFFVQFLYPKILNKTIKEGILSILFVLFFSFISLITSLLTTLNHVQNFINPENIVLTLLLIVSIIMFVKHGKSASSMRRTIVR